MWQHKLGNGLYRIFLLSARCHGVFNLLVVQFRDATDFDRWGYSVVTNNWKRVITSTVLGRSFLKFSNSLNTARAWILAARIWQLVSAMNRRHLRSRRLVSVHLVVWRIDPFQPNSLASLVTSPDVVLLSRSRRSLSSTRPDVVGLQPVQTFTLAENEYYICGGRKSFLSHHIFT